MRGISERPRGLAYVPDVVTAPEAERLLRRLAEDSYGEVRMRGQVARRTVRHYGVSYDFEAAEIAAGDPIPEWLSDVRRRCAELLDIADERLAECLLTRYPPARRSVGTGMRRCSATWSVCPWVCLPAAVPARPG